MRSIRSWSRATNRPVKQTNGDIELRALRGGVSQKRRLLTGALGRFRKWEGTNLYEPHTIL